MFFPVSLSIDDFAIAMFLTHGKVTYVLCAIIVGSSPFAVDFPVLELARVTAASSHEQSSLLILDPVDPGSLVLEKGVGVGITAITVP